MSTPKTQSTKLNFVHLNVHSEYSLGDGMCKISDLIAKAKEDGMCALALTDHGNMFGIKDFVDKVTKVNQSCAEREPKFKPIIGMDAYCARRTLYDKNKEPWEINPVTGRYRLSDSEGYRLTLLAKNLQGYQSLCKLTSVSYIDGLFFDTPRIDKKVLKENKVGLIVLSGGIEGELVQLILKGDLEGAENVAKWFKEQFGDDYYIELMRHKTDETNEYFYIYQCQMKAEPELIRIARKFDIKLVSTNNVQFLSEKHGDDFSVSYRNPYTKQEWLKSPEEMYALFPDIPEALENSMEIADKVEFYSIRREIELPTVPIPATLSDTIKTEDEYLEHLVWEGASKRYGDNLTDAQCERITHELNVIKKGFTRYFLLVWDIVRAAREELDVAVGPGRSSAAGSIVAYCLHITDIDPLRYGLLFERVFTAPHIKSPDIDIDFEVDGREKVIAWLTKKYGEKRVAHIITLGHPENIKKAVGIHTCGIVVAPQDISDIAPLCVVDDHNGKRVLATQYDGNSVEDVGLVKLDLLGLNILTTIKKCVERIKKSYGIEINIDNIPLDDKLTYKLFAKGNTVGVFLFESAGMQLQLRKLQTHSFTDLVALNSLYRPGVMHKIPKLIDKKRGNEEISYLLPEMEPYLKETYGITVYQEQIMLLSQKMAGFTPEQSNVMRKALGTKRKDAIDRMKSQFYDGGQKNGYTKDKLAQIWNGWETEGCLLFNKSHAVCYTWIAYQAAYLKAHYANEYLESVNINA